MYSLEAMNLARSLQILDVCVFNSVSQGLFDELSCGAEYFRCEWLDFVTR